MSDTFEDAIRHAMTLATAEQRIALAALLPETSNATPQTPAQQLTRRVANLIDKAGEDGITLTELARRTQGIRAETRGAVLRALVETGDYECDSQSYEGSGRPATIYRHRKRLNFEPPRFSIDAVREMLSEARQLTTIDIRAVFGDVPAEHMAVVLTQLRDGGEVATVITSQDGRSATLLTALPGLKVPATAPC